jgi:hypothetical protein
LVPSSGCPSTSVKRYDVDRLNGVVTDNATDGADCPTAEIIVDDPLSPHFRWRIQPAVNNFVDHTCRLIDEQYTRTPYYGIRRMGCPSNYAKSRRCGGHSSGMLPQGFPSPEEFRWKIEIFDLADAHRHKCGANETAQESRIA